MHCPIFGHVDKLIVTSFSEAASPIKYVKDFLFMFITTKFMALTSVYLEWYNMVSFAYR